ncbi:MAG TPA: serine hydrolase domain-containing protein, partial [Gemmatimonadales bacterium]|nr:serine hydrolase domain-containing protein [Gemmatimonadales bacterium]
MRAPLTAPVRATLCIVTALPLLSPRASAQTSATLAAAAHYSAEHEGDAVLVFRHDSLVLEQYQNGWDGAALHPLASGTKTFACVTAALARADGLLTLDEPVARTLPEFSHDPRKGLVTIRQLLNLTSGLEPELTVSVGNS